MLLCTSPKNHISKGKMLTALLMIQSLQCLHPELLPGSCHSIVWKPISSTNIDTKFIDEDRENNRKGKKIHVQFCYIREDTWNALPFFPTWISSNRNPPKKRWGTQRSIKAIYCRNWETYRKQRNNYHRLPNVLLWETSRFQHFN